MISTTNINQAKEQIKKSKKPIIVKSQNNSFNRAILEYGRFDILLDIETTDENRDKPKQLASGLNHILAKAAAKNNISIGIDLETLSKLNKKAKAKRLAKIKQNIKLCRKAKCKLVLVNYKDKKDAQDILISLGASSQQAKESVN